MRVGRVALALAGTVLCPYVARAQTVLTLADVLARARDQAPQIVSARLALGEARGRLAGASLRLPSNPEVDVSVGSRDTTGRRSTDLQVGATQSLEPPGRRTARVAGATAQLDQAAASTDETIREVLREASIRFYQALYATERMRLLASSETLADGVFQSADRRYRAGDIAVLEVNVARSSLGRARAARRAGEAELEAALGALRSLLGVEGPVSVQGTLAAADPPSAAALLESAQQRPELRRLEAAVREAEADVSLGRSFSRPAYGVGVRYEREGDDRIVLGGVTVTLPLFSRGQELRAVGSARAARLRSELEAARTRIRIQLQTALDVQARRVAAARALETDALPGLDENDTLTARSFDVGQIGLADVLLIRREMLDTRAEYLSALLEAALARVAVDDAAAVLR